MSLSVVSISHSHHRERETHGAREATNNLKFSSFWGTIILIYTFWGTSPTKVIFYCFIFRTSKEMVVPIYVCALWSGWLYNTTNQVPLPLNSQNQKEPSVLVVWLFHKNIKESTILREWKNWHNKNWCLKESWVFLWGICQTFSFFWELKGFFIPKTDLKFFFSLWPSKYVCQQPNWFSTRPTMVQKMGEKSNGEVQFCQMPSDNKVNGRWWCVCVHIRFDRTLQRKLQTTYILLWDVSQSDIFIPVQRDMWFCGVKQ